jgi:hypothetical protein
VNPYVLASASKLPEPPIPILFTGLRHTWTGWNGTTFDLTDASAGVGLLGGLVGMHLPSFEQQLDELAGVDGARYRSSRTRPRNPEWTIGIFGDSTDEWRERDQLWWDTLDPDKPGLWQVTDPEGRSRSLRARLRSSEEHEYPQDPYEAGWSVYSVSLLAEQPYWEGAPILSPVWGSADNQNFTGPDDAAPSYYIGAASNLSTAEMTNPGKVDAWLSYTITALTGGISSVTINAGGGALGYGAIAAGQTVRIWTDPEQPYALRGTTDVTGTVDPWNPRPIPAGETSPMSITLVGNGTVQASFTPRYYRAF